MEQGVFLVPAGDGEEYHVRRGAACSPCREACPSCGVCPHAYHCECEDSHREICKHAHAVATHLVSQTSRARPLADGAGSRAQPPPESVQELEQHMHNICEVPDSSAHAPLELIRRRVTRASE